MSPTRATIANLELRSNLMPEDYPRAFSTVTAFDLNDIKRRNRLLPIDLDPSRIDGVTPVQRRQWEARLRWGDRRIDLTDARRLAWLEGMAAQLFACYEGIASRLDEEQAFEILYLTEALRRSASAMAARAEDLGRRVAETLRVEPFGYSEAAIRERLTLIAGEPSSREEPGRADRPDPNRR